jgi:hypothetical protein
VTVTAVDILCDVLDDGLMILLGANAGFERGDQRASLGLRELQTVLREPTLEFCQSCLRPHHLAHRITRSSVQRVNSPNLRPRPCHAWSRRFRYNDLGRLHYAVPDGVDSKVAFPAAAAFRDGDPSHWLRPFLRELLLSWDAWP